MGVKILLPISFFIDKRNEEVDEKNASYYNQHPYAFGYVFFNTDSMFR